MFSVRVQWSDLENYLQWEFKQEIVHVPGDGVCFLKSVKHCLERDLDVNYTIDQISDKIFDEICDNSKMYTAFHMNSKCQLISDTLKYLNHCIYTMDIVNVVVQACANALKINLYIYEWTGSRSILIPTYCKLPSNRNIFLLYNRQGGSVHGGDHYSAIVKDNTSPKELTNIGNKAPNEKDTNTRKTNEWEVDESQSSGNGVGDLIVNISDLHDKFGDDFGCDDGQYFDEFGDVVDDSGHDRHDGASVLNADVEMEQITTENEGNTIDLTHEIVQTNTSDLNSITSTNTRIVDTDVEIVSDPADVEDGIEIPESYHHDGRPRKLKYKKKSINYVKFVQMDSVLVDEIPWDVNRDQKYQIECEEEDYIDKAKDAYCGALKVIEYDHETSMMTILYQGEHNCRPKPNRRKKFDEIRDLTKNDTSIQTPAEARRQVIKSLLAKGKVSEAVRVSRKMDDTSLLEKMRYMSRGEHV